MSTRDFFVFIYGVIFLITTSSFADHSQTIQTNKPPFVNALDEKIAPHDPSSPPTDSFRGNSRPNKISKIGLDPIDADPSSPFVSLKKRKKKEIGLDLISSSDRSLWFLEKRIKKEKRFDNSRSNIYKRASTSVRLRSSDQINFEWILIEIGYLCGLNGS